MPPSSWFDRMVRVVCLGLQAPNSWMACRAEGFAAAPNPADASYKATIQMLELCRFFGNAARDLGSSFNKLWRARCDHVRHEQEPVTRRLTKALVHIFCMPIQRI